MFYTYAHIRKDTGKIFYIGKGTGRRFLRKNGRNSFWERIAKKHGYIAEILANWKTEQEAFDHEKLLILCFKDMGYVLANFTDGGEGSCGYRHTCETRKKLAKSSWNKGKQMSEETKKKLSAAQKGKHPSNKGKPCSEEQKKKISNALKGRPLSEETKAKMSLAKLKNNQVIRISK
jgi:hypothetical protein